MRRGSAQVWDRHPSMSREGVDNFFGVVAACMVDLVQRWAAVEPPNKK